MRVSIVIDNYNYEAYVGQAIESALNQSHPDVEVVVVDDGSRDGSAEVIERYAQRHAGRVVVVRKPNGGQGSAYNIGFARSRGDVVIFLDADDWLYPEAAARIAAAWQPGVSKVQFRLDMVGPGGEPIGRQLPRQMHAGEDAERLVCEFGTYGSPPGSGNAFSAGFLRQVLPMDEPTWRIAADSVPILLAPAHGRVLSLDVALGAYRVHRPKDDGSLLFNNAPTGLAAEYERIAAGKRMVIEGLQRVRSEHASPLAFAPWEVRTLALCLRFGGQALRERLRGAPDGRTAFLLASIWRWPSLSLDRKVAMALWTLAVMWLPQPLALRLARWHRRAAGLPVPA